MFKRIKELFSRNKEVDCCENCQDCEECEKEDIEEGLEIVGHISFNLQENGKIKIDCDCSNIDDYSAQAFGHFLWYTQQQETTDAVKKYLIGKARSDMFLQPFIIKVLETLIALEGEDKPLISPCNALKMGHPTSGDDEDL